ncbi:MAG: type II CAAX prenyl endopeptidase Rce1 family protein [Candidatus Hermodarchaeota archaeon]
MSNKIPSRMNIFAFFLLVFFISLPIYIMGTMMGMIGLFLLSIALTAIPTISAMILTYKENGGVKELLQKYLNFKIPKKIWYIPIIFLLPILGILVLFLLYLIGATITDPMFPLIWMPIIFIFFLITSSLEEIGWQGYIYDRMEGEWDAFKAALILGTLWALWHVPIILFWNGHDLLWIVGMLMVLIGWRFLIVWIYNNTNKSAFYASLFHAIGNTVEFMFSYFTMSLGVFIAGLLTLITASIVICLFGPRTLAEFKYV